MNELARQVLGHGLGLAGQGHGGDYALCRFFTHGSAHPKSLLFMGEFYEAARRRPILLGYWAG
ncbi:hypothetical protein D9M70_527950 [compost metagenome]